MDLATSKKEMESKKKSEQEKVLAEFKRREQAAEKKRMEEEEKIAKEAEEREREMTNRRESRVEQQIEAVQEVDPFAEQFKKVQENLSIIVEAVSRETSDKISVTRADQQAGKQAVIVMQQNVITFLVENVTCIKEKGELRERVVRLERRIDELEKQGTRLEKRRKSEIRRAEGETTDTEEERMPRRLVTGELRMNVERCLRKIFYKL